MFSVDPASGTGPAPSPQSTVVVSVSSQPGSVICPLIVIAVFSGLGPFVVIGPTVGGTFVIVTFCVLQSLPPSSSVPQTVIV